jgi:hypothetical protein
MSLARVGDKKPELLREIIEKGGITVAETKKTAAGKSKAAAKGKIHEIKPGVPVHLFLKTESTDLQKFGHDIQVTLLAKRKAAEMKTPKKGQKTPKKGKS